jgi:hypothetical protein
VERHTAIVIALPLAGYEPLGSAARSPTRIAADLIRVGGAQAWPSETQGGGSTDRPGRAESPPEAKGCPLEALAYGHATLGDGGPKQQ